jgi:hypothetical protein
MKAPKLNLCNKFTITNMNIYIGDGSQIRRRIRNEHCGGNVEGSSLRKPVARAMGYNFTQERRISGSLKVRLDLPNPAIGEQQITNYVRTGVWKFVVCPPGVKAKDFQFYAIQNINPPPILNINQGTWPANMQAIYQQMLNQLINCQAHNYDQTVNIPNEPGVYLFIHDNKPT